MEFPRPLCLLLVFLTIVSSSQASKFNVGGSAGWVPNPSENYNQWAGRYRFQINDTLVFKYQKGSDSVLEVKKEDYDKCNKTNPIKKFEDGNTEFTFDRSGPFYFISGKDQNCEKGQKLLVVVLTPRGQTPTPPSPPPKSPSPSPKPSPPSPSPKSSPSPSPSLSPPAPAPTPSSHPPSPSVSPSPVPASGPPAPSPATSPAPAGKSPSPSPAGSPGPVSGPPAPTPGTSPSPAVKSPSPSAAGPSGPVGGPPAPSPGGTSPAGQATSPPGSYAWAAGPSSLLVYSVTILVGAVLLR